MATNVSYGFLRPREKRFTDIGVTVRSGNESLDVTLDQNSRNDVEIADWARGSSINVSVEFNADVSSILDDCSLPNDGARLGTLLTWNCPTTSIRGFGSTIPLIDGVNRPSAIVPGDQVAGTVSVKLSVVLLGNPVDDTFSAAPTVPGSVLWTRELRVHLEGAGATLPTTSYGFVEAGERDALAMWRITTDSDPELHVTRAVRIRLNTANRVTRNALNNLNSNKNPTKETQMWQRFLDIDIRVHLVWAALGMSQSTPLAEFEDDEESFGQTLYGILQAYFPDDDPTTLFQQAATDPGMISARVQNFYGDQE